MATKAPITCHILDTLTGRPAIGVKAELHLEPTTQLTMPRYVFSAETNSDGRITHWTGGTKTGLDVEGILGSASDMGVKTTTWRLRFFTGDYYGEGKTFWPEVNLTFYVKEGEHYHVPLLLGPYSYTTYRGS